MPAPLSGTVGMESPDHHRDRRAAPWDHVQEPDLEKVFFVDTDLLNDSRHPEVNGIEADDPAEVDQRQCPYATVLERIRKAVSLSKPLLGGFLLVHTRND